MYCFTFLNSHAARCMQLRTAAALLATLSVSPLARSVAPHTHGEASKQERRGTEGGGLASVPTYVRPPRSRLTGKREISNGASRRKRPFAKRGAPAALRVPSVLSLSLTLNRSCWHDAFLAGAPAATAAAARRRPRRRSFLCGVWCSRSGRGHGRQGLPSAATRLRRQ